MHWDDDDYTRIIPAVGRDNSQPPKEDTKKDSLLSPLKLGAGALAAVTAAILGSLLGNSGTLIGVAIASVITGSGSIIYEHGARQAVERARRQQGVRGAAGLAGVRGDLVRNGRRQRRHFHRFVTWKIAALAAGSAVAVAGAAYAAVTVTELALGNTLHGITTGTQDSGTTLGGSSQAPVPPVRHRHHHRHHYPAASPSPSVSPSATLSSTPTPTVSVSPSPSVSLSPSASPSPSPSPSIPPSSAGALLPSLRS